MESIGLNEMVIALRKELLAAQDEGAKQDLKFKVEEIELEIEVVATKEGQAGGGVKFWVYNAEMQAKIGESQIQKLRLKLKPEGGDGGDTRIADRDTK